MLSRNGLSVFNLKTREAFSLLFQQINLIVVAVLPKIKARRFTCIQPVFNQFRNDRILEQTAALVIRLNLTGRVDGEQVASQCRVVEVEFRTFDDALVDILIVGLQ